MVNVTEKLQESYSSALIFLTKGKVQLPFEAGVTTVN